jgi:hypothetical protein
MNLTVLHLDKVISQMCGQQEMTFSMVWTPGQFSTVVHTFSVITDTNLRFSSLILQRAWK